MIWLVVINGEGEVARFRVDDEWIDTSVVGESTDIFNLAENGIKIFADSPLVPAHGKALRTYIDKVAEEDNRFAPSYSVKIEKE